MEYQYFIQKKNLNRRQKKLKAYDLTSLNELLPELKDPGQREKEGKQLKAVLSNPVFQLDPLAAIHQHLERTQPICPIEKSKKKLSKTGKNKRKKQKATSAAQAMDL
ncbi:hypothetical protein AQUCO_01100155v1 [Aquilegia coerulea]|uniref:Uncharacterized protein n=1 Tax=Aquilegia coerulea TaxID=218851 RepID=A0A2G5E5T4_AQUCA|nr:hypothetical protein AQUCO_01100155v1 [Aquilegia coerulea]